MRIQRIRKPHATVVCVHTPLGEWHCWHWLAVFFSFFLCSTPNLLSISFSEFIRCTSILDYYTVTFISLYSPTQHIYIPLRRPGEGHVHLRCHQAALWGAPAFFPSIPEDWYWKKKKSHLPGFQVLTRGVTMNHPNCGWQPEEGMRGQKSSTVCCNGTAMYFDFPFEWLHTGLLILWWIINEEMLRGISKEGKRDVGELLYSTLNTVLQPGCPPLNPTSAWTQRHSST